MDLKQMRYFEAAVRHKSFSQAARELFIAQPALGFQIRKLEEELGVQLLVRNTRGVEPTEAGALFLARASKLLGDVDSLKQEMSDISGPVRGRISLGITPSIANILAVPLLQRCRRELPMVSINLVEDLGSLLTEWLLSDRLDMALAFSVPPTLGLSSKTLVEDSAYFISKYKKGNSSDPISFKQVVNEQLILPSHPNRLRQCLEDQAKACKETLNVCLEVQSPSTILNLVRNGFGSTVMSIISGQSLLRTSALNARLIRNPPISYSLALIRSDSSPLSKAEAVLQQIIEELVETTIKKPAREQA
ncbi:LysR family transcriptional regulator [Pusillimonas noertemannii]|uniref:LysR family transcriptional regulator n=1 Tax=Pusillimonas noertemannii TaxID=305977 RepID=UPI0002DE069E|nr:LysR substrate-binding domain-containing protein [Pusillimonas noertemannii]